MVEPTAWPAKAGEVSGASHAPVPETAESGAAALDTEVGLAMAFARAVAFFLRRAELPVMGGPGSAWSIRSLETQDRADPDGDLAAAARQLARDRPPAQAAEPASSAPGLLFASAGVGLWRYDPRTQAIAWSPDCPPPLAGAGVDCARAFKAACHPDDLPEVIEIVQRTRAVGEPGVFVHRLRDGAGHWMWLREHVRGERLAEGLYLVHGLAQNVTDWIEAPPPGHAVGLARR